MNLQDFLSANLSESTRFRQQEDTQTRIRSRLSRKDIYTSLWSPHVTVGGKDCLVTEVWSVKTGRGALFLFDLTSGQPHTIALGDAYKMHKAMYRPGEQISWNVTISTDRTNTTQLIKLVGGVLSGEVDMTTGAIRSAIESGRLFNESVDDPVMDTLRRQRRAAYNKYYRAKTAGEDAEGLAADLDRARGAIDRARAEVRAGGTGVVRFDSEVIKAANRYDSKDGLHTIEDLCKWSVQEVPVSYKEEALGYLPEPKDYYQFLAIMSICASNAPDRDKKKFWDSINK